jgi:hypothetical protein
MFAVRIKISHKIGFSKDESRLSLPVFLDESEHAPQHAHEDVQGVGSSVHSLAPGWLPAPRRLSSVGVLTTIRPTSLSLRVSD